MAKTPTNSKEYLVRAKLYKAVSMAFLVLGLIVFMILYIAKIEGRLMEALRDPTTLVIFIFPFLPAAFLSWLSGKNEKKYEKSQNKSSS